MNMQLGFITIKSAGTIKRIETEQILYIVADRGCLTFHLQGNEPFLCSKSLGSIEKLLPRNFVRIYRNCIVNVNKTSEVNIRQRTIMLVNGTELTVSFRNMKTFTDSLVSK
jgi:DNA-binding LytR/AlgR family response regulator